MPLDIVTVRKLEAAKRQLQTAITLWFGDADPVSVHTLACAAHQIIHDINADRKGNELLLDSVVIRDEFRSEYLNEMRKAMNFFKHANRDPDPNGSIEFSQAISELFILFSIIGIERFGEQLSKTSVAFLLFYAIKNPHLVAKEFSDRFKVEYLANVPAVSKREFFEHFLHVKQSPVRS
jgi:hypothetical protein